MLEHGAYTLLLDACYDRERFPTIEEALEWSWARTDDEVAAVKFVLSKFFTLTDSIYAQQRVKDEIDAYRAKSIKNQEIALAREAARRSTRERIEHETCTEDHLTNNHKPLTTNQEPEDQSPCDQQAESPDLLGDDLTVKPATVHIPYDQILAAFAKRLPSFPQPRKLEPDRRQAVKAIWTKEKDYGTVDFFDRYFGYVAKSDFLMGETGWKSCNFDWIFKPKNFRKIIEGTYHKDESQ